MTTSAYSQAGCPDPQALNYDQNATVNDGSCEYPFTNYIPREIIKLDSVLNENSALIYFDDKIWTANDSQNGNRLYSIDTLTGKPNIDLVLKGATNVDWEDLAQSETQVFVGDFGNNNGNRKDLVIYRFEKQAMNRDTVSVDTIEFFFSDQTDFSHPPNGHNFDCEALLYLNDSLHLFSKNWENNFTKLYRIPNTPGRHEARLVDSFDVEGLITAADISPSGAVTLLGYNGVSVFMWLLFDYQTNDFFSGNKRKINLGFIPQYGQTEGLTFVDSTAGYISSEQINLGITIDPRLLYFDIGTWIKNEVVSTVENTINDPQNFVVYPMPFQDHITLDIMTTHSELLASWYDGQGRVLDMDFYQKQTIGQLQWTTTHLPPGVYVLKLNTREGTTSRILIKQ